MVFPNKPYTSLAAAHSKKKMMDISLLVIKSPFGVTPSGLSFP
jgi:hypothetical protein